MINQVNVPGIFMVRIGIGELKCLVIKEEIWKNLWNNILVYHNLFDVESKVSFGENA